ncbi:uncharacterized protein [Acropora muricata]|uniref:uncharacterized protein n=1 Tax=Acropora muricata TaxID=159855 RepID=UPI0034E4539E
MGNFLSRKSAKQHAISKRQARSFGLFSKLLVQPNRNVILRNGRFKEEKASKLDEQMPQFSVLSFMASDKSYYDPKVLAQSTAFSELNPLDLPSCLVYQGYHEFGYHLFRVKAEEYEKAADMETKAIINCICKIVGDENVVVTYEYTKGKTAYLNCFHSKEDNIFQELCVRLREQLLRVVLYKPSWYVQFWQENDASELFS